MMAEKKINLKKTLKIAASAIWWCVLILLFFLLVTILSAKMKGKVPKVFGYSVMHIVSGSMEDEIPKDSYILVKTIAKEDVRRGDIICFYSDDPMIYGMPNTHRVVEDPICKDGIFEYVTKGDANASVDKVTAKGDKLVGVYVRRLDSVTAFVDLISGNTLIFVFIGLQLCLIGMAVYSIVVIKSKKKETDNHSDNPTDK